MLPPMYFKSTLIYDFLYSVAKETLRNLPSWSKLCVVNWACVPGPSIIQLSDRPYILLPWCVLTTIQHFLYLFFTQVVAVYPLSHSVSPREKQYFAALSLGVRRHQLCSITDHNHLAVPISRQRKHRERQFQCIYNPWLSLTPAGP